MLLRDLEDFGRNGPDGESYVVAHDVDGAQTRTFGDLRVRFVGLDELIERLGPAP